MIKDINEINIDQFSSSIEEIKQEIMALAGEGEEIEGDDAIILEVIQVIQEEIVKRKSKAKKTDIKSDVRFLAYLNLFNTIMDEDLGDEDFDLDEDFETDADFDDDFVDVEEEEER